MLAGLKSAKVNSIDKGEATEGFQLCQRTAETHDCNRSISDKSTNIAENRPRPGAPDLGDTGGLGGPGGAGVPIMF